MGLRVQPPAGQASDDPVLPDFKVDDTLRLEQLTPKQHFTSRQLGTGRLP